MSILTMASQQPNMQTENLFDEKQEPTQNRNSQLDDWDSEQTVTTTPATNTIIEIDKNQSTIREQGHESYSSDLGAEEEGPIPTNDTIPDGGTAAWLVVLGAWCVSFCSYGWINSASHFPSHLTPFHPTEYAPHHHNF